MSLREEISINNPSSATCGECMDINAKFGTKKRHPNFFLKRSEIRRLRSRRNPSSASRSRRQLDPNRRRRRLFRRRSRRRRRWLVFGSTFVEDFIGSPTKGCSRVQAEIWLRLGLNGDPSVLDVATGPGYVLAAFSTTQFL